MASPSYIVAADVHIRPDAIEAMKQLVAEVTARSLDQDGFDFLAIEIAS